MSYKAINFAFYIGCLLMLQIFYLFCFVFLAFLSAIERPALFLLNYHLIVCLDRIRMTAFNLSFQTRETNFESLFFNLYFKADIFCVTHRSKLSHLFSTMNFESQIKCHYLLQKLHNSRIRQNLNFYIDWKSLSNKTLLTGYVENKCQFH